MTSRLFPPDRVSLLLYTSREITGDSQHSRMKWSACEMILPNRGLTQGFSACLRQAYDVPYGKRIKCIFNVTVFSADDGFRWDVTPLQVAEDQSVGK